MNFFNDFFYRHNNEPKMATNSTSISTSIDIPGGSSNVKKSSSTIVDLCESPKKNPTVQSRLSKFFRKPTSEVINDEQVNSEQGNKTDEFLKIDSLSIAQDDSDDETLYCNS